MDLNYDNIQREAESFATQYREKNNVPSLPTATDLIKYKDILYTKFAKVTDLVKKRVSQVDSEGGHGFEHLEYVATMAGFIAEIESDFVKLTIEEKTQAIEQATLAGLLHDIERHLGWGEDHMIEGEKTARKILLESEIENELVPLIVRNHDHIDFDTGEDKTLKIVFGAVFDADHFRYGLEREDTFWRMMEKKGQPAEKTIHDYEFLFKWENVWRTNYGKQVGPQFIRFGVEIAKHIETVFSGKLS